MSVAALQILEQFRRLSPSERREVCEAILREPPGGNGGISRKTIADIAGKYRPQPDVQCQPHDKWFTEAALASRAFENG
jgi:hypothetical protein